MSGTYAIGPAVVADNPGLAWLFDPLITRAATDAERERYAGRRSDPEWAWLYGAAFGTSPAGAPAEAAAP